MSPGALRLCGECSRAGGEASYLIIYLVGFMGSGKTSVGRELAARLGVDFVDLDAEIERREGTAIREIFRTRGEGDFRRIEQEELRRVSAGSGAVVALGGGAFCFDGNRSIVRQTGKSVWLDTPFDEIYKRCAGDASRPLFTSREEMAALLERRRPSYSLAEIRIATATLTPAEIAGLILSELRAR